MANALVRQLKGVYDTAGDANARLWFRNWALGKQDSERALWNPFVAWLEQVLKSADSDFADAIEQSFVKVDTQVFPKTWQEWFGSQHISPKTKPRVVQPDLVSGTIKAYATSWGTKLLPTTFTANVAFVGNRPTVEARVITITPSNIEKVSSKKDDNNSFQINVPDSPFSAKNERTSNYVEWAEHAIAELIAVFNDINALTGALGVYVTVHNPGILSWWSIDFVFLAFCAAHRFAESAETSMTINIQLNNVPSVCIKQDDGDDYSKRLELGVLACQAQPEHLFWWGKFGVMTQQSFHCPGNSYYFRRMFREKEYTSAFRTFVTEVLDSSDRTLSELQSNAFGALVGHCSSLRINLTDLTACAHQWVVNNTNSGWKPDQAFNFFNGPTVEYRAVPEQGPDTFVVYGFDTIFTADDCESIFGHCDNGADIQSLWQGLSTNGSAIISSTIFIPGLYYETFSLVTFYYIFVAIAHHNLSRGQYNVYIAFQENYEPMDAGLFRIMAIMGYQLFENKYRTGFFDWAAIQVNFCCLVPQTGNYMPPIPRATPGLSYALVTLKAMFFVISKANSMLTQTVKTNFNQQLVDDVFYNNNEEEHENDALASDADIPNADAERYSKVLSDEDRGRLLPGLELTDLIITQYAKELRGDTTSVFIFDTAHGNELITNSNTPSSLLREKFKLNLSKATSFIIPANVESGKAKHWVCFYYQKEKSRLYFFDSLQNQVVTESMLEAYNTTLISHLKAMEIANSPGQTVSCITVQNLPQQTDGYNCGVFVLRYIEAILENPRELTFFVDPNSFDADDYRRQLYGWAYHGAFPSLKGLNFPGRMRIVLDIYRCQPSQELRSRTFYYNGNSFFVRKSIRENAGFGLFANKAIEKNTQLFDEFNREARLKEFGAWLRFPDDYASLDDPEVFQSTPQENHDDAEPVFEQESESALQECWVECVSDWKSDCDKIVKRCPQYSDLKSFLQKNFTITIDQDRKSHAYALMFNQMEWSDEDNNKFVEAQWCDPYGTFWGFINHFYGIGDANLQWCHATGDEEYKDPSQFYAIKRIEAGEELCYDYGPKYNKNFFK